MSYTIDPRLALGEVKLQVSDLPRSLQFYTEVIGFQVMGQTESAAALGVEGDKTPLLLLELIPNAAITRPRSRSGLYHFAILLPTRTDLGVILHRLIAVGIQIGQADHLVSEALYISDPDGNGIEIYRDRPREMWPHNEDGSIRMATDPIDWDGLLAEGAVKPWAGLPPGTQMGHIHLHVSDLTRSRQFYCDVLGFEIAFDARRMMGALFLSTAGYHHHLGLNVWAGEGAPQPDPQATGLGYYTIRFSSEAALGTVLNRLQDAGIEISPGYTARPGQPDHSAYPDHLNKSIHINHTSSNQDNVWFVTDPSGIRVKLSVK